MKFIRYINVCIQDSRVTRLKIDDKITYLKYKNPNNSQTFVVLEQELVYTKAESLVAEARLSNIIKSKLEMPF